MFIISSPVLFQTSKSLGSWAGVIFTTQVQNSLSTYSSATIGISLFTKGNNTFLPIKCWYLGSSGCTATQVSHNIVSGLVVARISLSFVQTIG